MVGRPYLFMTARSQGLARSSAAVLRSLRVWCAWVLLVLCIVRALLAIVCVAVGGTSIAPRAALRSGGHLLHSGRVQVLPVVLLLSILQ